jgi:hypothetical protein
MSGKVWELGICVIPAFFVLSDLGVLSLSLVAVWATIDQYSGLAPAYDLGKMALTPLMIGTIVTQLL